MSEPQAPASAATTEPSPITQPSPEAVNARITSAIATELGVGVGQVRSAVDLLDGGATVPFVARYRKEATGNLDDTHLRTLEERLLYLRELEERRAAILASIEEQGKLTGDLRSAVEAAATKQALEDIYLPYKPRRRTKAQIAREAGLEPLAEALFADPLVHRNPLEFRRVDARHPLWKRARRVFGRELPALWARRSLFRRRGRPLMVTEVFLPEILELRK